MNRPAPKHTAANPPEEKQEEASDLWLALTQLPRPGKPIPFPRCTPGTDIPVGEVFMWPLRQEEQQFASVEADRHVKKILKDPQRKDEANLGYHSLFTNELAVQVLWRACRDINSERGKRAAFPSPGMLRRELTTDETGVLFANYITVQQELGPIMAYLSSEEQEALIIKIHEAGSAYPFDSLSPDEQKILVTSLVSRLVNCWMAMFSVGLPLDASSTVEESIKQYIEEAEKRAAEAAQASDESSDDETDPDPAPNE